MRPPIGIVAGRDRGSTAGSHGGSLSILTPRIGVWYLGWNEEYRLSSLDVTSRRSAALSDDAEDALRLPPRSNRQPRPDVNPPSAASNQQSSFSVLHWVGSPLDSPLQKHSSISSSPFGGSFIVCRMLYDMTFGRQLPRYGARPCTGRCTGRCTGAPPFPLELQETGVT